MPNVHEGESVHEIGLSTQKKRPTRMHTFSFEGFSAATLFPLSSDIGRGILKQKAFSPPSNPFVHIYIDM